MDYDASIAAGDATIGIKRTEGGRYAVHWQEAGAEPSEIGEFTAEDLAAPTSTLTVLPNGQRPLEGGKAWIHGDRVLVISPEDWKALLGRLGVSPVA